jgi:transcriptional regulator with XRE-family HTH domain
MPVYSRVRTSAPDAHPAVDSVLSGEELGNRLRSLRQARGWTLEEASDITQLSRAAISKIERGDVSPTFDALLKLSKGLKVELAELLSGSTRGNASGRRSIVRAGSGDVHEMAQYALRMLISEVRHPAFIPYEFTAKAAAPAEFGGWDRHESEDLIYVLEGTMVLHCELYDPVELHAGDAIYFDARMGHLIVSAGDTLSRGICISSAPAD